MSCLRLRLIVLCLLLWPPGARASAAADNGAWPKLPECDGSVVISVQDDPAAPARPLTVHVRYPATGDDGGRLENVSAATGLMLAVHNWGGVTFDGAPKPETLAKTLDVVAIGVTYYQSGRSDPASVVPYDFGYLQTMDALRALYYVYQGLRSAHHPFDAARIYGTGGSGGGNVIQMANKFAPHTFACIVDLSGMASLTDDIAYNLPGGSRANARYSRDPASPAYLAPGMQEIRDLGNLSHLALQAKAACRCKVVVIHGEDDNSCLASDKHRVVDAMRTAGLDVDAHFLAQADVDGTLVRNSGHGIGNRTSLLLHFAGEYLTPKSPKLCRLAEPCDFDRRQVVAYPTSDGVHTISYASGPPTLTFTRTDGGKR